MKKALAIILSLIIALSVSAVAFAADIYTCPTCSQKYDNLPDYNKCVASHSETDDEEADIYECATCGKKFDNLNDYNNCVDSHFDNNTYYFDHYFNDTITGVMSKLLELFNGTGIKEFVTEVFEKLYSLVTSYIPAATTTEAEIAE